MKSTPTARFEISSCCMPITASRVRPILALGSTILPAGVRTPLMKRELLEDGEPLNSPTCTWPSRLVSCQHPLLLVEHAPDEVLGPHVNAVWVNRPVSELASVIFVS